MFCFRFFYLRSNIQILILSLPGGMRALHVDLFVWYNIDRSSWSELSSLFLLFFFLVSLWTCSWLEWFSCWLWALFGSFWVSPSWSLENVWTHYELSCSLSFTNRFDRVLISRLASFRRLVTFYLRQCFPCCRLKNWNCSVSWILKHWSLNRWLFSIGGTASWRF